MRYSALREKTYRTLLDLSTDEGILASSRSEIYGCIFGRDSAITILKILKACSSPRITEEEREKLIQIVSVALKTLIKLQGTSENIESGEEPGKFIHEFRKNGYEHLLNSPTPWFIYPDGMLRNYDSIDSTPLCLIAIYRYYEVTSDSEFLLSSLSAVKLALQWIIKYGDRDHDFLIEYEFPKERQFGGLRVQSWTDSYESLLQADGTMPLYPIAPVEVQGYAWLSLHLWADFFEHHTSDNLESLQFARKLRIFAQNMKRRFNEAFIMQDGMYKFAAQALEGNKKQITTITANPMLLLWATYMKNGKKEAIIDDIVISDMVSRAFQNDLFDRQAGLRTMSTTSPTFNPYQNSYHNGSFWPKLNGMAHEGLMNWGFNKEANLLYHATLRPIEYFGSPIELYVKGEDGTYLEFSDGSQKSCHQQAWSAAAVFDLLTLDHPADTIDLPLHSKT